MFYTLTESTNNRLHIPAKYDILERNVIFLKIGKVRLQDLAQKSTLGLKYFICRKCTFSIFAVELWGQKFQDI